MPASYSLTTKTRIKSRLGITSTSFDALLDSMIASVTDKIEQMASRRFLATTYTNELYDGSDVYGDSQSIVVVQNSPILTLTSFQYNNGTNASPSWFSYTADDYDINESNGIIYVKGSLPKGKQNVRLNYQAGYLIDFTSEFSTTQHTLPADISEVCEEVVVRIFKRRDSDGRQSESFQESSITWTENVFTKENVRTINNYRRTVF